MQSVKTPTDRKPGQKMSTYGGAKRRPKADRYFEDSTTARLTLNEHSLGLGDASINANLELEPSKRSK
jgi:hypothetical protein